MKTKQILLLTLLFFTGTLNQLTAQTKKKDRKKEFYFSWGYNKEWYTRSNIKIDQPALGNHYSFENIQGHDHPGWDNGIFNKAISIPQYNYRFGLFLNKEKGIAVEINFDHTKFIFADQAARIKGTLNYKPIDSTVNFSQPNFHYYLNNGANFLLFNIVKRTHLYKSKNEKLKVDFLGKLGVGPVIPHVDNAFFGKGNKAGFQLGGWNVGAEAVIRTTFFNTLFLEYCNKLDYARYSNLSVYNGTAKHAFGTYEMIVSMGCTFPVGARKKK